jgi:hypothetical protein
VNDNPLQACNFLPGRDFPGCGSAWAAVAHAKLLTQLQVAELDDDAVVFIGKVFPPFGCYPATFSKTHQRFKGSDFSPHFSDCSNSFQ